MTAQNDKQIDKRVSSMLSSVDRRTNEPDKQFLEELRERSTAEFLAHSTDSGGKTENTIPISKWKIIMKSKITKIAAAAVIIGAVILGLTITGGPDIASVTWAEVIEKVEQVPALSFDMTTEITYTENEKLTIQSENYVAGDYGTKSSLYMNGEVFVVKYRLHKKKVAYQIRPKDKTYFRFDLSDEQVAKEQDTDDPRTWLKMILSGDYTNLGHTKINDIDVEGIECSDPEIMGGGKRIMRLWVDVETSLPVRIEVEAEQMEAGQKRPHKFVMENFQWNVELDENVLEPNIPPDYKLKER